MYLLTQEMDNTRDGIQTLAINVNALCDGINRNIYILDLLLSVCHLHEFRIKFATIKWYYTVVYINANNNINKFL